MALPKKVRDRLAHNLNKFQNVIRLAKDRDVNESDTVTIIADILSEVFGYDKYSEITSEYCIRGTFCDLGIKIDNKIALLIEAKAIGIELKQSHLRQAIDYAAKEGVEWVVLTNGMEWQIHRIIFGKPVSSKTVCSFNFNDMNAREKDSQEKLFLLCREGVSKAVLESYYTQEQATNRFALGALILNDAILSVMRRELKRLHPDVTVDIEAIKKTLNDEVIKREIVGSDKLEEAKKDVNKARKRSLRKLKPKKILVAEQNTNIVSIAGDPSGRNVH